MKRRFYWVDAFTSTALSGNPCAVLFDCDDLDVQAMQAIAREMNLSETAFVMSSGVADVRARYFTTQGEIPMAGHPTIATIFALVDAGRIDLEGDLTRLSLELQVGPLDIEILASGGVASAVIMAQKPPQFLGRHDPAQVLPALGLDGTDALDGAPIEVVSTGTPQLMVPVTDLDAVHRARVDGARYEALASRGGFMSVHVFCLHGATGGGHTFARHFAHRDGSLEDPFTGSSTGAMGAYLWQHRLITQQRFVAQQGHGMGRPGEAGVEVVGPPGAIETVRVAGAVRVLVRGEMDL